MAAMTMRQRMLAVLRGERVDRVPFVQYTNLAGPNETIWSTIGRDNLGLLVWTPAARFATPNCRTEREEFVCDGVTGFRDTLHTPAGSLTQEKLVEPAYGSAATRSFSIQEPDDYRVLCAYLRDTVVEPNVAGTARVVRELGEDGLPHFSLRRTPYQRLWIEWVRLDQLCLHLVDYPDQMAEVIDLLRDVQRRVYAAAIEVARQVPVAHFVVPDNIHAPAIGERYFREYCLPAYAELATMRDEAGLDLPVLVHMDGDLRPLWPAIGESVVDGLDSLSPPPDNDTRVGEAAAMWPGMKLMPNFPSSVHLSPPDEVYRTARSILEEAGHTGRLWIQISENVPREAWRSSFPAIVRAIDEFGRPDGQG